MTYKITISWREYREYTVTAPTRQEAKEKVFDIFGCDSGESVTIKYDADARIENIDILPESKY